jgi:hypothetical protein
MFVRFVQIPSERTTPCQLTATSYSCNLKKKYFLKSSLKRTFMNQNNYLHLLTRISIGPIYKLPRKLNASYMLRCISCRPTCIAFLANKIIYKVRTHCYLLRSKANMCCRVFAWIRGFETHRGHGCSSLVFVMCCVSSGLWDELITQKGPTGWLCLIVCDLQTSKGVDLDTS